MDDVREGYLDKKGTKGEYFLKLENVIDKGEYKVHKLVDRNGLKAMFYNYKGEDFSVNDCILVKATLAEYRTFKDEPFSYLNRVTVLKNVGAK